MNTVISSKFGGLCSSLLSKQFLIASITPPPLDPLSFLYIVYPLSRILESSMLFDNQVSDKPMI